MDIRGDCWICMRKVGSGLGRYPWSCANGHTLYRGSGLMINETGVGVPANCYEPPASEAEWLELVDAHRRDADYYAEKFNEAIRELKELKAAQRHADRIADI